MSASETENHRRLKTLAVAWAQANGFGLSRAEVRVPRSGFRADVAACGDGPGACTAVFECKQARADLLKDSHAEAATRWRLAGLTERRRKIEELFTVHRPELRRGEAFWAEYDSWDFSRLEHRTYRRLLLTLATVQRRVKRGTKFSKMIRYRSADFLYLVVEDGIFAPAEVPAGWGLLVRSENNLRLARPPVRLDSPSEQRAALIAGIAGIPHRRTGPEDELPGIELALPAQSVAHQAPFLPHA